MAVIPSGRRSACFLLAGILAAGSPVFVQDTVELVRRRLLALPSGHALRTHRPTERRDSGVSLHRAPRRADVPVAQPDRAPRFLGRRGRRHGSVSRTAPDQRRSRASRRSSSPATRSGATTASKSRCGRCRCRRRPGSRFATARRATTIGLRSRTARGCGWRCRLPHRRAVPRQRVARAGGRAVPVRHEDVVPSRGALPKAIGCAASSTASR